MTLHKAKKALLIGRLQIYRSSQPFFMNPVKHFVIPHILKKTLENKTYVEIQGNRGSHQMTASNQEAVVRSGASEVKRAEVGPAASDPETWSRCHIRFGAPLFYFHQWLVAIQQGCSTFSFHTRRGRGTWCIY